MTTTRFHAAAVLLAACLSNTGWAQGYPAQQPAQRVQRASGVTVSGAPAPGNAVNLGQYPQLNAPMYPSPVQYTPPWTGGTVVTNQAFAPHEFLYPHDYHAMYPPFYYKVKGGWIVTPFGVRSHEQWKLQGTEVRVKYRSSIPLTAGFIPPRHLH